MLPLVNTQMSPAMRRAFSAISTADRSVFCLERFCGGEGVHAARADGGNAVVRVDDLARAGNDQELFLVGDDQQRLQLMHDLVASPVLRE